jgi:hypothetical protein
VSKENWEGEHGNFGRVGRGGKHSRKGRKDESVARSPAICTDLVASCPKKDKRNFNSPVGVWTRGDPLETSAWWG